MSIENPEQVLLYIVKNQESHIELAQTRFFDSFSSEFHDLRSTVPWVEVTRLARRLGCRVGIGAVYPENLDQYSRVLIYCAVRLVVPQPRIFDLGEIVLGLNGYDLVYWSMHLKRAFWADDDDASLRQIATAFMHLFGLT